MKSKKGLQSVTYPFVVSEMYRVYASNIMFRHGGINHGIIQEEGVYVNVLYLGECDFKDTDPLGSESGDGSMIWALLDDTYMNREHLDKKLCYKFLSKESVVLYAFQSEELHVSELKEYIDRPK